MTTPNERTVGWRFSPKDEELINHFLRKKINGKHNEVDIIGEIDICKWDPADLPELSVVKSDDKEWFFFCQRDQKFQSSLRQNRSTKNGYWKATGKDRKIKSKKSEIGMKRTLVYHTGRAPTGKRTFWIIHEYRATLKELDGTHPGQRPYVLCRLFKKDNESVLDGNDNDMELASLSPIPFELSPTELKPEPMSHQVRFFNDQECEKVLVTADYCEGESSNATSQEPMRDTSLDYLKMFGDPDPYDISLLESPVMESMGSSLAPLSGAENICVNGDFQPGSISNEHSDFPSGFLESILADCLDNSGSQGNNWISDFDFEIPVDWLTNQNEVTGVDSGPFLNSNSENTELENSHLAGYLEQHGSNAESSGHLPMIENQELGNVQNGPEYQGVNFISASVAENNLINDDHVAGSGIQIRHRQLQPQATVDYSNANKHGTAERRIRLQTKLGRSLISTTSEVEGSSKFSHSKNPDLTLNSSCLFSSQKPPSLSTSHKLIFGMASVLTIFVVYAGILVCKA